MQFTNFAEQVTKGVQTNTESHLSSIDNFAIAITSDSKTVNASWPFVTFPDFDILGASVRHLANASYIMMFPIVTRDKKATWGQYSAANAVWLSQRLQDWTTGNETSVESAPTGRLLAVPTASTLDKVSNNS